MITHLKGSVEEISGNQLTLDVNGVGYCLICSAKTIDEARDHGGIIKFHTVLNVREDSWTLYGFFSAREKFWFNMLNSVQGVGGKVAIAILSALSDDDIYNAFLTEDKNIFTRADGVGPKLATRIISELKEKIVGKIELNTVIDAKVAQSSVMNDVISALVNLGYTKPEILRTISSLEVGDDPKFDVLLKQVLAKLSMGDQYGK